MGKIEYLSYASIDMRQYHKYVLYEYQRIYREKEKKMY